MIDIICATRDSEKTKSIFHLRPKKNKIETMDRENYAHSGYAELDRPYNALGSCT